MISEEAEPELDDSETLQVELAEDSPLAEQTSEEVSFDEFFEDQDQGSKNEPNPDELF
jgi:hypothetical protein